MRSLLSVPWIWCLVRLIGRSVDQGDRPPVFVHEVPRSGWSRTGVEASVWLWLMHLIRSIASTSHLKRSISSTFFFSLSHRPVDYAILLYLLNWAIIVKKPHPSFSPLMVLLLRSAKSGQKYRQRTSSSFCVGRSSTLTPSITKPRYSAVNILKIRFQRLIAGMERTLASSLLSA